MKGNISRCPVLIYSFNPLAEVQSNIVERVIMRADPSQFQRRIKERADSRLNGLDNGLVSAEFFSPGLALPPDVRKSHAFAYGINM